MTPPAGSMTCRCGLPLQPPNGECWRPGLDAEPASGVLAVALYGEDPGFLRRERVPGGWHTEGAAAAHPECTPPAPWQRTGICWAQVQHPVVDVTAYVSWINGAGAELHDKARVMRLWPHTPGESGT